MIGVDGQYILSFTVGKEKDFIAPDELLIFSLIEEAGNALPTFQLSFLTVKDSILYSLNEQNSLNVSYGKTTQNTVTSRLVVTKLESNRVGENRRQITVIGLYAALGYLGTSKQFISDKKSGVAVMKDIVSPYFVPDFNIDSSTDTQNWIQYNISDRKFVNDLWLHADLGDSFPTIGISSDVRFILKDVLKDINKDYKWRFTTRNEDAKRDILYDTDPAFSLDTGLINNWVGYSREKLVYNMEEGSSAFVKEEVEPTLSLANKLVKTADVEKRFASVGVINENVHENYWKSYQKNLASLAQFSSMKLTLSFRDKFVPIRILDLCMYMEEEIEGNADQASEYHSGLYFVTKVSRTIANSTFVTLVQICREAPNKVRIA
jgi:hypothetical protein